MKPFLIRSILVLSAVWVAVGAQTGEITSLPAVKSQAEFDQLAVVYDPNTPYALPHALFVIDRQRSKLAIHLRSHRALS